MVPASQGVRKPPDVAGRDKKSGSRGKTGPTPRPPSEAEGFETSQLSSAMGAPLGFACLGWAEASSDV